MIFIGFVAISVLTMIVCLMWVYTAIEVQKEQIIMERFYMQKMQQEQKCNACGRKIKTGEKALIFKNMKSEHFDWLSHNRLCVKCMNELKGFLDDVKLDEINKR